MSQRLIIRHCRLFCSKIYTILEVYKIKGTNSNFDFKAENILEVSNSDLTNDHILKEITVDNTDEIEL